MFILSKHISLMIQQSIHKVSSQDTSEDLQRLQLQISKLQITFQLSDTLVQ